jgi:hypothetical protein
MTNLLRAALQPRIVRPVLFAIAGATLLCATCVLGMSLARSEIVVAPPMVFVPQPQVTVSPAPVVMPATPVVVEPPAPAPLPAPQPPPPPPRALAPMLDAGCVIPDDHNPTCTWDEGFPAISADGTLIATKYIPPMGQSDFHGVSIHFIDAKTSRLVRDSVLVTRDEAAAYKYPRLNDAGDPAISNEEHLPEQQRMLATIYRRVARVQRTLDAKRFRTLLELGSVPGNMGAPEPSLRGPNPVYAEIVGTTARIIDSAASRVLWRGEFYADGPKRSEDDVSDCGAWSLWSMELWWDPKTRYVVAAQQYRTGGCMCPDVPVEIVQQMR